MAAGTPGNVCLAAFYGPKPQPLARYIREMQRVAADALGTAFVPYEMEQAHATLIGLEGRREADGGIASRNFAKILGEHRHLDLAALIRLTEEAFETPLVITFGGYHRDEDYGFFSRGEHPHDRSFVIQPGRVVIMGWESRKVEDSQRLGHIRADLSAAYALHRYHDGPRPTALDDDLYMVIGTLTAATESEIAAAVAAGRDRAQQNPLTCEIGLPQLSIVNYVETTLSPATSTAYPLPIKATDLERLY